MMEFFREAPIDAIFLVCLGAALVIPVSIGLRWRAYNRRATRQKAAEQAGEKDAPVLVGDGVYWIYASDFIGYALIVVGFARWILFD